MSTRKSYSAKMKLKAISHAKTFGTLAAAEKFEVHESMIRRWKVMESRLQSTSTERRAFRGLRAKWPQVEAELKAWIVSRRDEHRAVNGRMLRREAHGIASRLGLNNFHASCGWIRNFMKRNQLSTRRRMSVGQLLPEDYKEKMIEFRRFYREHGSEILPHNLENLDEVSVLFDIVHNYTVDVKGKQDVSISTTGNEKNNFTVVLAVLANGDWLPPMNIFKKETLPKGNFQGVTIKANPTGWMISDLIMECWSKRSNCSTDPKGSLLILDSARCHITDDVKTEIQKNSVLAVIAGGLTKLLQPLDISVNKPFKDNLKKRWEDWMADSNNALFTKEVEERNLASNLLLNGSEKVLKRFPLLALSAVSEKH